MSSQHHGVELGALLNAAREGTYVEFELTDTEGSATVSWILHHSSVLEKVRLH